MMRQMRIIHTVMFVGGLLACAAVAQAQTVKASLTPTIDTKRVHAGQMVKVRLGVHLPDNLRVPSDKPDNRNITATLLTIDAPPGVTVSSIFYPRSSPASLAGQKKSTLVFGPDFTIIVQFRLAPTVAAGTLNVPALLRYQACNDSTCYEPATMKTQWTLHVAGGH
jgi:hypothetical protein